MKGRTSAELERDAEVARANVAETADAIRSKMTPGQMIDEFTGMLSGGDGEAALSNLKAQIRDNPLPLTLVGAGVAWLMLGQGGAARTSGGAQKPPGSHRPGDMDQGSATRNDESSGETLGRVDSDTRSKAGRLVDAAKEAVGDAGGRTTAAAQYLKDEAGEIAGRSKAAALDVFEKEPLALAAVGMAIGTAIGVLLPSTTLEDENLGSVSTKVRAKADELLNKGVAEVKDLAAEAYQTVKEEADQQGLGGEGTMTDKVSKVIKSTAQKTEATVRDKLQR